MQKLAYDQIKRKALISNGPQRELHKMKISTKRPSKKHLLQKVQLQRSEEKEDEGISYSSTTMRSRALGISGCRGSNSTRSGTQWTPSTTVPSLMATNCRLLTAPLIVAMYLQPIKLEVHQLDKLASSSTTLLMLKPKRKGFQEHFSQCRIRSYTL